MSLRQLKHNARNGRPKTGGEIVILSRASQAEVLCDNNRSVCSLAVYKCLFYVVVLPRSTLAFFLKITTTGIIDLPLRPPWPGYSSQCHWGNSLKVLPALAGVMLATLELIASTFVLFSPFRSLLGLLWVSAALPFCHLSHSVTGKHFGYSPRCLRRPVPDDEIDHDTLGDFHLRIHVWIRIRHRPVVYREYAVTYVSSTYSSVQKVPTYW